MAEYCHLKMKRKCVEDVADDFPLSSPATKMRRLDVELPPIMEEEPEIPAMLEQSVLQEQILGSDGSGGLKIEELPNAPENEERAIVLFKPFSTPFVQSPSIFSVDPHLFSGLRNRVLSPWRPANDDEVAAEDGACGSGSGRRAVVPWVPPRHPSADGAYLPFQIDHGENVMDTEELGEATMEVEHSTGGIQGSNGNEGGGGVSLQAGLHQWPPQLCMIPQPPRTRQPQSFGIDSFLNLDFLLQLHQDKTRV